MRIGINLDQLLSNLAPLQNKESVRERARSLLGTTFRIQEHPPPHTHTHIEKKNT